MNIIIRKRRINIVLILAINLIMLLISATLYVHADGVKIAQATSGEGGKLTGCKAGDQSGNEFSISGWTYGSSGPFHWEYVFRAKDTKIAKQISENMIAAANNNHIGYDQNFPDRNTFFDEAESNDWDISTINNNCETTCSSAISVCLNAAGVKVPRTWSAGEMYDDIMKTEQFECFTSKDYTASSALLLPGDILVSPGTHAAMVVESPNKFQFDVHYRDQSGEEQMQAVEEGTAISINFNNGEKTKELLIEDEVDLRNYEPQKQGAVFKGWQMDEEKKFMAKYSPTTKAINTKARRKDID